MCCLRSQPCNFLSWLSEAAIAAIDRTSGGSFSVSLGCLGGETKGERGGGEELKVEEMEGRMKGSDGEVIPED